MIKEDMWLKQVEPLLGICEALSSNPSPTPPRKRIAKGRSTHLQETYFHIKCEASHVL
jgi:hypothetical protein